MTYFRGECLRVNRLPRRFVEGVLERGKGQGESNKVIHANAGWRHEPEIICRSISFQRHMWKYAIYVCIYLYYYQDFLRYIVFWIIGAIVNDALICGSDKEIPNKAMICGGNRITWINRNCLNRGESQSDVETRNYSEMTFHRRE